MSSKAFAFCLLPFVVLATLNAGGYRYGASDQAFYLPVVLAKLDPGLFPRDASLLAAQSTLTTYDEVIAAIVRVTGAPVPAVFALLYVAALTLIALGAWLIGNRFYLTTGAVVTFLAALTLRHAIARSGTNTLEGYFHPRQMAFGLGIIAVAAFLRGRFAAAIALVLCAGAVHPTAALWFAIWLTTAAVIVSHDARRWMRMAIIPVAAVAAWALLAGPLAGRLTRMDDDWLRILSGKDYLFILEWPMYAWVLNLGYLAVVGLLYTRRQRAGVVSHEERALVLGSSSLALVFLLAVVAQAMHLTLAFQLQPARLFLCFDLMATMYAVWALAEMPISGSTRLAMRPVIAAALIVLFSLARGAYVLIEAKRPAVQVAIPDDDWGRAMAWAKSTPKTTGWLADPMHAMLYGTSVRVAGERDVFVEGVKDTALGIYDRRIAVRTDERLRELDDFRGLSVDTARSLASRYDLDYLVTVSALDLPLAFESGSLRIYKLR